jgi:hypothetical protein
MKLRVRHGSSSVLFVMNVGFGCLVSDSYHDMTVLIIFIVL